MKKIIVLILLLGLASSCAVIDTLYGAGYTYMPKDKSFKIVFDGKPTIDKTEHDNLETPWGKITMNVVYYPSRFSMQAVYYADLPTKALKHKPKQILEQVKNSRLNMIEEPKKHVKIKNLKHTTFNGHPAMTAKVKVYGKDRADGKQMYYAIYRSMLVGKRLYEIMIINREEYPSDIMVGLFMDSFKANL